MTNIKTVSFSFSPVSEAPEISCPDGELMGADHLFPVSPEPLPDSPEPVLTATLSPTPALSLPPESRLLLIHRPTATSDSPKDGSLSSATLSPFANAVFSNPQGDIFFIRFNSQLQHSPEAITAQPLAGIDRIVPHGDFIVILRHDDSPLFARFDSEKGTYTLPAPLPHPQKLTVTAAPAPISVYAPIAGDPPKETITLPCPDSIQTAVRYWLVGGTRPDASYFSDEFAKFRSDLTALILERWKRYHENVVAAGLSLYPRRIASCLRCPDGNTSARSPWQETAPNQGTPMVAVTQAAYSDSNIGIELAFSWRPYSISVTADSDDIDDTWRPFATGWETLDSGEIAPDPASLQISEIRAGHPRQWVINSGVQSAESGVDSDCGETMECGRASGGISLGNRLLLHHDDRIYSFAPGNPLVLKRVCRIEGERIDALAASFRSLSSGQFGEFPLYAFCADGLRALSPDGDDGFRSVQLISRDILLPGASPLILSSAVAFPSPRGLLLVEGAKISHLVALPEGSQPAYHYPSNSILLLSAESSPGIYSLDRKAWIAVENPLTASPFPLHPDLFILDAAGLSRLDISLSLKAAPTPSAVPSLSVAPSVVSSQSAIAAPAFTCRGPLPAVGAVFSRPLKLGSPAPKFLLSCCILPSAERVSLEASDDLARWYPILSFRGAVAGLRLVRPWRFYRLVFPRLSRLPLGAVFSFFPASAVQIPR